MSMKHYTEFENDFRNMQRSTYLKQKKGEFSNDIFTFDIETTSMFYMDGAWHSFDYSVPCDDYLPVPKAGCCYIWMFGCNDTVYYGRYLDEFKEVLNAMHKISAVQYTIYIHNLSFEMQWLLNIFNEWTIENMVARSPLKPISFKIKELDITFRCSYMLTNLSLSDAAKKFTNVRKASGDLDYHPLRGSKTWLTKQELYYCEMDIITLYYIILYFRDRYNYISDIPLTSTSIVRKSLNKRLDYFYHKKMWQMIPPPIMLLILMEAFQGGYTHANILNALKTWKVGENCDELNHEDETSAYPTMMFYQVPSEPFWSFDPNIYDIGEFKKSHYFIFHVKFTNLRSKYYNNYIAKSKIVWNDEELTVDNGRLVSTKGTIEMFITSIDLEIIEDAYYIEHTEYVHIWASKKGYFDKRILEYVLELYGNKTKLKNYKADNPDDQEYFDKLYMNSKSEINGIYGMSVTKIISSIVYNQDMNQWSVPDMTIENLSSAIEQKKHSFSVMMFYGAGIFITALNRRALWSCIIGKPTKDYYDKTMDRDSLYADTDSIFYKGAHKMVFEKYNEKIIADLKQSALDNGLDFELFHPKDVNGVEHMLGVWDDETNNITEFRTLGAKKYVTREGKDQTLHMTVSGLRKAAVSNLHDDINNFDDGLVFNYNQSRKLTHFYYDDQAPITFNDLHGEVQHCTNQHSIVLQPTTYTLGYKPIYERLHELFEFGDVCCDMEL